MSEICYCGISWSNTLAFSGIEAHQLVPFQSIVHHFSAACSHFHICSVVLTDQQVSIILQEKITTAFLKFASTTLKEYHLNPKLASLPIEVKGLYLRNL